jgi:uncharacterized repeat protein (TIGR02543 family)
MLTKKRTNPRRLANVLAIVLLFSLFSMPSWSAAAGFENTAPAEESAGLQAAPEIPAETPAEIPTETPADEIPEETPAEESPAEEIPAETPAEETPAGFPENLSIQAAPMDYVYVNIYRDVSGTAPVYKQTLTSEELASLTSIDAPTYYLAAGISAAWTLDTAQPGAAPSQSVSVASIAGNAVNFYFNAPTGSWTGVESIANPVNPQVTGQSVVVYTYAALKAALQSAAYSYIEFGADLAYTNTATSTAANTEATITIAPNRAAPELTLNAKWYEFRTNRTGNNVIRFAGTTANSNLTRIVYQNWNVPEHRSAYGLFYGSSTRVVTLVFDGLMFTGPQLADLSTNSNLTLDGTRSPVDIIITRPGNTGDAASEVADAGNNLVFQGSVGVIRENVTGTTSLFTGFDTVTLGAESDLLIEDRRASGVFVNGSPTFTLERGSTFLYRGNRQFTSSNLGSLTIGEDVTFNLRANGAIASTGLLRVGGPLTIGNNATFLVMSENNSGTATAPVVYVTGNISITNPLMLLVSQSGTSSSARAWGFSTGRSFSYTGTGLARWDTGLDTNFQPNGYWTNWDNSPLTITGTTAASGRFTNLRATGYDGKASALSDFSFGGKVVSDIEMTSLGRYAIQYWLQGSGSSAEAPLGLPEEHGYIWPEQSFNIYFPLVDGYRRVANQPTSGVYAPGTQTIKAYYESLGIIVNPIELEKTAVRLDGTEWEITLTINSDSESYTPTIDTDIMLVLDRSSSMTAARRNAVRTAAIGLVDTLTTNELLLGQIRIGVVQFSSNNATSSKLVLPLTAIRNGGAAVPGGSAAVTDAIAAVFSSADGLTYINLGIDYAHNELYHSPRTNPYSIKHMVLLSDGEATSSAAARTSATAYKSHAGEHTDGKLTTIGLETTTAATNLLREIQNAGYYSATGGNVSEVFAHIADAIIISALQSGMVVDPVGAGFEFRSVTGAALPAGALGSAVAASQGTVTLETRDGTPTLLWNLSEPVDGTATLRYRVRLLNPSASKNTPLPTNGTTTLSYVDSLGVRQSQNFDVPVVVYGTATLTVAYEGLPAALRPAAVVHGPFDLYPTAPAPFLFDGPLPQNDIGFRLDSVTLTGSEIIDGQVVEWDISAGSMYGLIAWTDDRITALGSNRYILEAPTGDLTITYHYNAPVAYDIVYHNVRGTPNPNPATYTVLDTAGTGLALHGLLGRPGYTFTGWYADAAYTIPVTALEPNALGERDYWAKWGDGGPDNPNKPDSYTVTYHNLNGAPNPNPATYTIIDTPLTLRAPARTGYVFEGWYADAAYTVPVRRIDDGRTGSLVFWAKWTNASAYTITYHNVNGATNPNPDTYTLFDTAGAALILKIPTDRPGYTFTGWYADAAYTIPVTEIELGGLEDRDFWAKWGDGGPGNPDKPDTYTITYHEFGLVYTDTYTIIDTPFLLKQLPSVEGEVFFEGWEGGAFFGIKRLPEGTTGDLELWPLIAMV